MKKETKKDYRSLVLNLHKDVKMEMKKASEVLKLLSVSYYTINNDTNRDKASRDAALIMLTKVQEIKRNKLINL